MTENSGELKIRLKPRMSARMGGEGLGSGRRVFEKLKELVKAKPDPNTKLISVLEEELMKGHNKKDD